MIKKINEAFDHRFEVALDEALPKDLMQQIRRAPGNRSYGSFNRGNGIYNDWNPETGEWDKPVTHVADYANATYREVTPNEVKAMKKAGQNLSNVYIMKKGRYGNPVMLNLDSEGHPYNRYSSAEDARSNQSLKKSLEDAEKIYVADIPDLIDSDPEKAKARLSDRDIRSANLGLGHDRPDYSRNTRGGSYYAQHKREHSGTNAKINAIKAQYDAGDISRKEMEKQIAQIRSLNEPNKWEVRDYNDIRNHNAQRRYRASEIELQKSKNDLKDYRRELSDASYSLRKANKELADLKSGSADKYTGSTSGYNYNKKSLEEYQAQLKKLQREMEYTQQQIDKYSKLVNSDAQQAELDAAQKNVDDQVARMNAAQANIDKLLRRNK